MRKRRRVLDFLRRASYLACPWALVRALLALLTNVDAHQCDMHVAMQSAGQDWRCDGHRTVRGACWH